MLEPNKDLYARALREVTDHIDARKLPRSYVLAYNRAVELTPAIRAPLVLNAAIHAALASAPKRVKKIRGAYSDGTLLLDTDIVETCTYLNARNEGRWMLRERQKLIRTTGMSDDTAHALMLRIVANRRSVIALLNALPDIADDVLVPGQV